MTGTTLSTATEAGTGDGQRLAAWLLEAGVDALDLFHVYIGDRLGLYQVLAEHGPLDAAGLAGRAGVASRYAQEWLEQQAVALVPTPVHRVADAVAVLRADVEGPGPPVARELAGKGPAGLDVKEVLTKRSTAGRSSVGRLERSGRRQRNSNQSPKSISTPSSCRVAATYTGTQEIRDFWATKSAAFKPGNNWIELTATQRMTTAVRGIQGTGTKGRTMRDSGVEGNVTYRGRVRMRRAVLMLGLAALAATVLPLPALADGLGATTRPRHEAPAPAAREIPFTLGDVPCSLIPVPAAGGTAPVAGGTCPGVRPGGRVVTEVGGCTFNFLFRAPDGTRYIGTAGHCIGTGPVWPRERVWPRGSGPVAEDADRKRIGEFAYAVLQDPKDFALIRLDPGVAASPEMCSFGGPSGVYTSDSADPVVLQY
jgi:hypothetical protein